MTTLGQLKGVRGSHKLWRINGVLAAVKVLDIRVVFGRTDFLVEPCAGEGSLWVSGEKLKSLEIGVA